MPIRVDGAVGGRSRGATGNSQVLQAVAALRGVSDAELAHAVYENTVKVFFPTPVTRIPS